jgi:hypothetical protein
VRGVALALLSLAACADEDSIVELGVLAYNPYDPPRVEVPLSVAEGVALHVDVTTFGDGCVTYERTDLDIDGDVIDIFPYDRRELPPPNGGCTLIGLDFDHGGAIIFKTAGAKLIRVHGRRVDGRIGRPDHEVLELTYEVSVTEPL